MTESGEHVKNGGFEQNGTNWTIFSQGFGEVDFGSVAAETGTSGLWIGFRSDHMGQSGQAGVQQNVDLTGVDHIYFSVKYSYQENNNQEFKAALWIDGQVVDTWYVKSQYWSRYSYNVEGYTGTHQIRVGGLANPVRNNSYCYLMIDNVSAYCYWTVPVAKFTASPQSGNAPLTVQFVNKTVATPTATYRWKFGDGTESTASNPSHVYPNSGQYMVELVASNVMGQSLYTIPVYAYGLPFVNFYPVPEGGGRETTVTFVNTSTAYPDITAWSWWFEGGQYPSTPDSTVKSPTHTYIDPGRYTVRLRATNSVGTVTKTILDCVTISDDLSVEKSIANVGILINGKLLTRF